MKVGSIGWLGVRTENSSAMCSFYRDVLRLEPLVGFFVDSFEDAYVAMLKAGIQFLYPLPQRQRGKVWVHFRAPNGNVYEIIGADA
jgi:hypothetical protein